MPLRDAGSPSGPRTRHPDIIRRPIDVRPIGMEVDPNRLDDLAWRVVLPPELSVLASVLCHTVAGVVGTVRVDVE
jgi:hypothetical protein